MINIFALAILMAATFAGATSAMSAQRKDKTEMVLRHVNDFSRLCAGATW